jgi:CubicO group peptidase (beta-lactamase class C family)
VKRRDFLTAAASVSLAGAVLPRLNASAAQSPPSRKINGAGGIHEQLKAWLTAELAEFEIPGAAVSIVRDGEEVVYAFGVRRLGEAQPVDPHTAFSLASCSKAFTAVAIGILVDRHRIGFDDQVRVYLPEFTLDTPAITEAATIRDLLGMRLGLEPLGACRWGRSRAMPDSELFQRLQFLPRVAPFREGFVYFNPAYSALADIVARVSGQRFPDVMAKEVSAPLGLRDTFIDESPVTGRSNIAFPHVKTAQGLIALSAPHCGGRQGESCMYVSGADLLPWLRFQLSAVAPHGQHLLTKDTAADLHRIQMPIPNPNGEAGYCMGWMRGTFTKRVVLTHEGGEFGASTFIILSPEENLAVSVLLSRRAGGAVRWLAYGLRDQLIGKDPQLRKSEFLEGERKEHEPFEQYMAEHLAVDLHAPMPDLDAISGRYHSAVNGTLTLAREANRLRATFEDIDAYNCRLEPLGGEIFRVAEFDDLGMLQEIPGEARLRIARASGGPWHIEMYGVGTFERAS